MADTITILDADGTPQIVATDQDPGTLEHAQLFKLAESANGSLALIPADANGLLVKRAAASGYHAVAGATNNAASIKGTPGTVHALHVFNNAGYPLFAKLYDKATAPAPAVDTPKRTIGVQAGTGRDVLFGTGGLAFAIGIGIALVKGIADNDDTATATADAAIGVEYA
jgi:hypothetical protein